LGTVAGSPGSGVPATPPPAKGSLIRKHATW
jgi:hypothetical protein